MRRTLLFFLLLFFLQSAYSQNKTIGLVLKGNFSGIDAEEKIDPLFGFEIGGIIQFHLRNKLDFETGAAFRFSQYQVNFGDASLPFNRWKEKVFYFKIPLELSYHITPNKWRAHVGIWCSYLISVDFGRDVVIFEHRGLYSDLLFGFNTGFGRVLKSGAKVTLDFSLSINNIYGGDLATPFGKGRTRLGALSLGVLVPLKF